MRERERERKSEITDAHRKTKTVISMASQITRMDCKE